MKYKNSFFIFIKRFLWRIYNLSLKDFFLSYFPKIILIPHINFEFYKKLSGFRIEPKENINNTEHFMLIKPEGLAHETAILHALDNKGITVKNCCLINNYMRLEINMYNFRDIQHLDCSEEGIKKLDKKYAREFLSHYLRLEADKIRCPHTYNKAKLLILNRLNHSKIRQLKKYIRKKTGHIRFYHMKYGVLSDTVFTSYIHIPDKENLEREYSIVQGFLAQTSDTF